MINLLQAGAQNAKIVAFLRIAIGLIWFSTFVRRIAVPNFQERIESMASGSSLLPEALMTLAAENWEIIYFGVLFIEILTSISLIFGIFAKGGALLATFDGILTGMAGFGLGPVDLIIPWSVAAISLFLVVFTHPGLFYGIDQRLKGKNLPVILKTLI